MLLDQRCELLDVVLACLVWQVKAEVAFGHDEVGGAGEGAEDRDGSGDGVADHVGVRLAADVVEDHAGDAEVGIEAGEAVDERGGAAGHRARVDDEDDGELEQLGHLGGAAAVALSFAAVEEAHHAFDHGDVGIGGGAAKALQVGGWG